MRRTCRVFLVGEGQSDIGDLCRPVGFRDGNEGFLQPILRRLVGDDLDLEFAGAQLRTLAKTKVKTANALLSRHAAQAHVLAEFEECAAVVFSCDVDRTPGERATTAEAKKRIESLRTSIEHGFSDAESSSGTSLVTIIATPCRMIEAWALADPDALVEITGNEVDGSDCDRPEELWGAESDPDSRHPKRVLQRIVGDEIDLAAIADLADLSKLEAACPLSFAPFAEEVRREAERCSRTP